MLLLINTLKTNSCSVSVKHSPILVLNKSYKGIKGLMNVVRLFD